MCTLFGTGRVNPATFDNSETAYSRIRYISKENRNVKQAGNNLFAIVCLCVCVWEGRGVFTLTINIRSRLTFCRICVRSLHSLKCCSAFDNISTLNHRKDNQQSSLTLAMLTHLHCCIHQLQHIHP